MSETASSQMLSIEECQTILHRWQKEGLTDEERDEYMTKAAVLLTADSPQASTLEEHIKDSARMAHKISDGFQRQMEFLKEIMYYCPSLVPAYESWLWLRLDWMFCLRISSQISTETSDTLQRFETIYLAQVETIQTEEDRSSAITALASFLVYLNEKDRSAEMSGYFLKLRRDVAAFAKKYPVIHRSEIIQLSKDIECLDAKIKAVQTVIGAQGENVLKNTEVDIGHTVSNFITSLQELRQGQAKAVKTFYEAYTHMNMMVAPRLQQSESSQARSDTGINIDFWPDHILDFAEIWSSIRGQNVQFSTYIKGSLEAATSLRFKAEVRLARQVCTRLQVALSEYKEQIHGLFTDKD